MLRSQLLLVFHGALAHRPLLDVPSCAPMFSTPSAALHVPDISISWAMNALQTCDADTNALWLSWTSVAENMKIYIGVGVPTMKRFDLIRADYLVVGPGLPALTNETKSQVPEDIMKQVAGIPHSNTFGYWYNRAPDDQSTCAHLCDEMKKHSKPRMGRCDFYEPFTDTHSWRLVEGDEVYGPNVGATYYVAVWLRPYTSGKFGVAIGTWKEDFFTKYDLDSKPLCDKATKDFDEKVTLAKDDPVQYEVCSGTTPSLPWEAKWEGPDECGTCGSYSCGCDKSKSSEPSDCKPGEVIASVAESSDYGAAKGQCAQMCTGKEMLKWMAGVKESSCADQGYGTMVEKKEVTPPGSPMPVSVTIMGTGEAPKVAACKAGEVDAYIVGPNDYGAEAEQCTQMCSTSSALQWMAGVSEGKCADEGYGKMVEQKKVKPAGSPMSVEVTTMGKGEAMSYGSDGSNGADGSTSKVSTSAAPASPSPSVTEDSAVAAASATMLSAFVASMTLLVVALQ